MGDEFTTTDFVFDKSMKLNINPRCGALAPVATNGGYEISCSLDDGHPEDVLHEVKIKWK